MFGVGVLTPKEDAAMAAMGHTGLALSSGEWVNISNPAAINKLDSLTFYFNIQLKAYYTHLKNDFDMSSVYSGNIDAITMAFRTKRWWCMAIGYAPYSAVGYEISDTKYISGTYDQYSVSYKGSGGLSQAYWTNAFTFFNHFTVGANVSVLWGSITKREIAHFYSSIGGEDITNERKYTMNNMFFEFGAQWDFNLGHNNFRFGVRYNDKRWLHSSYDQTISNSIDKELMHDDVTSFNDRFQVPRSYGAGIAYTRNRWLVTADYNYNEWGSIPNVKFEERTHFKDNYSVNAGFQYTAGKYGDPFYKRIRYRAGRFYRTDYLKLRQTDLKERGVTLGLTIPIGNSPNSLTISYEQSVRGQDVSNLVKETTKSFKIAFNVKETWFMKSKFD